MLSPVSSTISASTSSASWGRRAHLRDRPSLTEVEPLTLHPDLSELIMQIWFEVGRFRYLVQHVQASM